MGGFHNPTTRIYNSPMRGKLSRREAIFGTGALLGTGTIAVALSSQETTASVASESLSIPNKEQVVTDQTVNDILISVTAGWSFESNTTITGLKIRLKVGSTTDSAELIGRTSVDNLGSQSTSRNTELIGSILSSGDFEKSQFNPDNGSISTDITVVLEMDVLNNGTIEKTVSNTDTATVTISAEEVSITANVGGEGGFTVEAS